MNRFQSIALFIIAAFFLLTSLNPREALSETESGAGKAKAPSSEKLLSAGKGGLPQEFFPERERASVPGYESSFEKYLAGKTLGLRHFGYALFTSEPSSFQPSDNIPVNPDYILGPGDELRVSLWGRLNAEYSVVVDRDGKVNLPEAGIIFLNGLTFNEARAFLKKELARYYLPSEVKMNVSMGALRSIRVYVVGNAVKPGSYSISSMSTVLNALFAAGGPSKTGSMRKIELKRNGATVAALDLYDLLLKGDKSTDLRLASEDVVFIPPAGPLAAVAGEVRSPAIYELKDESSASELFALAGGLNETAIRGRLRIERIMENTREAVLESDLSATDPAEIKVQPGDLLTVYPVIPDKKIVRIEGAVERGGEFGIGSGLRVRDLIALAGGPRYYAYTEEAELTRITPEQSGPVTTKIPVKLGKALDGDLEHNIELRENDYLFVRTVPEWELYRTVRISGEVRFPGTYTIKKGETASSLIERAGGFTGKAYLRGAVFTRESVRELQQAQLDEALDRLEKEILAQSASGIGAALDEEAARIEEVALSNRLAVLAKMKSAKARGRISIRVESLDDFRGGESDLVLEDGDRIHIPERAAHVQVIGAVHNQTAFVHRADFNVKDYMKKAGGLTRSADSDGMYILKVDGTAISRNDAGSLLGWDRDTRRWTGGGLMSASLEPGDTIVVPEKADRTAFLRDFKDITQILYQIAVTAGVLIVAF